MIVAVKFHEAHILYDKGKLNLLIETLLVCKSL